MIAIATIASGTAHSRCTRLPRSATRAWPDDPDPGTISSCVSLTELTTASAWIAALAIVALIATGWRKPARAAVPVARGRRTASRPAVEVQTTPSTAYRGTPLWRRIWAVFAASTLAAVTGTILAILIAAGLAYTVVTLTDMLRR